MVTIKSKIMSGFALCALLSIITGVGHIAVHLDYVPVPGWFGVGDVCVLEMIGAVSLAFFAGFLGLGYFFSSVITGRIKMLTDAAAGIAEGNAAPDFGIQGGDEIGGLASAFTKMAGDLESAGKESDSMKAGFGIMAAERAAELKTRIKELEAEKKAALESRLLAEAANRAKNDFFANLSHEMTTPLNSVIGFSQVFADELYGALNEKQKEYALFILNSGMDLLSQITDMIDLSKALTGDLSLRPGRFLVRDLIESCAASFHIVVGMKNLKLSWSVDPEADIEIEADSIKLTQVIFYLINNAVKFTHAGGAISIGAQRMEPEDGFIEIYVADTGIGIKAEDIPSIVGGIGQLEYPYVKQYKGAGIGLALSRKLIELHGGIIRAESVFGKGSVFSCTIPVRIETGATDDRGVT